MSDGNEDTARKFYTRWRELQTTVSPYRNAARIVEKKHAKNGANYNIFNALSPNEVRLSNFFKHLLDPNGSHGQEASYLKLFLSMLDVNQFTEEEMLLARVVVEDITLEDRRIDILIEIKGLQCHLVVGIENKPTAFESKNQVGHYQQDLVKRFKGAQHILLFLSGRGECSQTSAKSMGVVQAASLIEWAYTSCGDKPTVASWIQECRKITAAPSVWSVLLAFESYLEETFFSIGEEKIMNDKNTSVDHEALFQYAIQPENIAMTVELQGNDIVDRTVLHVFKNFFAKINTNLQNWLSKNDGWIMAFEPNVHMNGAGITMRLGHWKNGFSLKLEIWGNNWVIGLRAPLNTVKDVVNTIMDGNLKCGTINLAEQSQLVHQANILGRKYKTSPCWPRYRDMADLKGRSNETLKKLTNETDCNNLARELAVEFTELAEVFRNAPALIEPTIISP